MANKIDAQKILELVGGKENVASVTHCATRLRIRLKNDALDTLEEIKKISGVMGIQKNVGELQVIIGPAVDNVYQEFIQLGGFKAEAKIDENLDAGQKKGFKAIANTFFEAMTGCISPVVYAFVVMGMFKSVSAIFGPSLLNILPADSDLAVLMEGVSNAITYFLPFLLAYSSSQKLGANTTISLVLAAVLVSPTILGIVEAGAPFKVFGLFPMTLINYTSTFLPIILIVAVQVYVERFLNKVIPDVLKTIFVPTFTVAIMLVLGLCILGPIGQWLGNGLAKIVMLLSEHAGWLEGALVCALYVFMVAFGLGGPVFLATFAIYMQTGTDYLYFPYMAIYSMVLVGIDLGYIIKTRSADEKQTGLVALTSQLLGGVSEPTIYGVLFRNKTILAVEVIACAIAGFYCGLTHTAVVGLTFGLPVVGNFLAFSGLTTANMVNGCISVALGMILGFVGTLFLYKGETE
ncbi:MAG: PTS transporter subunit EIIC [Erysipelotrichaceae bacterium]|nr:PTS transporter subunit EIIC [Erysipelotrichaceae bacterium]